MAEHDGVIILLCEDEEAHADLVRMNLSRSGLANQIMHFNNGLKLADFLFNDQTLARNDKYLVILDINMPGLDGRQVLERVKHDKRTQNIPVVMLTTAEDEREVQRCYNLGCNLYLPKPMEYEDFCSAVHQLGLFIQKAKFPEAALLVAT
jgi:CheY-like chemotaxis protein